jgi:flagellar basal body P-ring formation protein FlgA
MHRVAPFLFCFAVVLFGMAFCGQQRVSASAAATSDAAIQIDFHTSSLVRGKDYTLGDIASVQSADADRERSLESLVLGRSPGLGSRMTLSPRSLAMSLERLGIGEEARCEYPKRIYLEREVQDVDLEDLREAILDALNDALPFEPEEAVVDEIRLPRRLRLPGGEVSYTTKLRFPRRGVGTVSFRTEIVVDGHLADTVSGSLKLDRLVEVLTVVRSLVRGEPIGVGTCQLVEKHLSELRGAPLTSKDLRAALRAKRDLELGAVLTWSNAEKEILVRSNKPVRMLLNQAGLRISTVGKSRANGALGDVIEVTNAKSGRRVRGVVVGRQTVRVGIDSAGI